MVTGSFDFVGVSGGDIEAEADPVLLIDLDGPLTLTVSTQLVQPVPGRRSEFFYALRTVKLRELNLCPSPSLLRHGPGSSSLEKTLRLLVLEAFYHREESVSYTE